MISPYIFGGISGLVFNTRLDGNKFAFAIPFGFGLNISLIIIGRFLQNSCSELLIQIH